MTTGELIQKHREAARLSQRELAEASGVPLRTLEKIEQGVISEPKLVTVAKIAPHLGMTCSDFIPTEPLADQPSPSPADLPAKAMGKRK